MAPRGWCDGHGDVGLRTIAVRCGEGKRHENENGNESESQGCPKSRSLSVSHGDLHMRRNEEGERRRPDHYLCSGAILL